MQMLDFAEEAQGLVIKFPCRIVWKDNDLLQNYPGKGRASRYLSVCAAAAWDKRQVYLVAVVVLASQV